MSDELFKNKFRIQPARLPGWDYSSSGWYFITICTKNRENYFGEITNNVLNYSELGFISAGCWLAIQRAFKVIIPDAWIIMPNHIHLLFAIHNIEATHEPNKFNKTVKNSVSSIINHFKGRVTKYAKSNNIEFAWQTRFHDHIVRNIDEFNRIQSYIINNPQNYQSDKFYNG